MLTLRTDVILLEIPKETLTRSLDTIPFPMTHNIKNSLKQIYVFVDNYDLRSIMTK